MALHLDCIDDETPQFRMCTPPWIRPGSVRRQVPNFGFVLVNVRFTLSFFCVFVLKRVFISALGPKRRWIHFLNLCKSSLFGWSLAPGGRNLAFHTAFLPPEHTNECSFAQLSTFSGHTSYYAVRCIAEFSYNFRHMSCKLFMCLFYLSTASLRNIHWKSVFFLL